MLIKQIIFLKKAFTLLELTVVFSILFTVLLVLYWQIWRYKITFSDPFTVWLNNVKVTLCRDFQWNTQKYDYCNWFDVNKLFFWNTWFTEVSEWDSLYWNVDLTKYVTNKKDRRTIEWNLWEFDKALNKYYDDNWINCEKDTFYIINWIYFDCKLNKIKYLVDRKNLIRIVDWTMYLMQ